MSIKSLKEEKRKEVKSIFRKGKDSLSSGLRMEIFFFWERFFFCLGKETLAVKISGNCNAWWLTVVTSVSLSKWRKIQMDFQDFPPLWKISKMKRKTRNDETKSWGGFPRVIEYMKNRSRKREEVWPRKCKYWMGE